MNRSLLLALIGGCPLWLSAQSDLRDIPPPQPPLVASPKPYTQWTIVLKYPEEAVSPSPAPNLPNRPVLLRYQCTQEITAVTVQWADGSKKEGYVKSDRVIFMDPKTDTCSSAPVQDDDPYLPLFTTGYPGVAWIELKDYQGVEMVNKEPCYRFFKEAQGAKTNTEMPMPSRTAWIRVKDRQPAWVKIGTAYFIYSPIEEAPTPVSLSNEVRAFIGKVERQHNTLNLLKLMNKKQ